MESFEEFAQQYEPMIYKIMNTLHIYKNKEEFFQLGLIGLWEARLRFDEKKGGFLNYAYTYIKGLFLAEMTRMRKLEDRTFYPKEEFWENIESPCMEQSYDMKNLLPLCEGLTFQQKKWVLYTCIEDLSIREIAEKENVSISAVKQWRTGARQKLRMYSKNNVNS